VRAALRGRAGRGVARLGVRTVIPHDVADSATHRSRTLRDLSQMDRALATNQPSSMRSSDPSPAGELNRPLSCLSRRTVMRWLPSE
jgi:hypothetical protein